MGALYENLRVYKKAFELVAYFENLVRGFDRYHKYTIGSKFRILSSEILVLIAKANTKCERKQCLEIALDKLEELKILVHIGKEIKAFRSFKSFEFVTRLISDVSRQCEGWFRSQNIVGKPPAVVR